jgi:hypothetical protein
VNDQCEEVWFDREAGRVASDPSEGLSTNQSDGSRDELGLNRAGDDPVIGMGQRQAIPKFLWNTVRHDQHRNELFRRDLEQPIRVWSFRGFDHNDNRVGTLTNRLPGIIGGLNQGRHLARGV